MGVSISSLVFQPPRRSYGSSRHDIINLATKRGGKIPAQYVDRRSSISILYSHSNAEDLGMIWDSLVELSKELNVNILSYDYEGYGLASGSPSEESCYDDIDAAYLFLIECLQQKPENIIVYGRSLGSGPSCYLAERLSLQGARLGGLVLQSALSSIYRVAFNFRFTLFGDMFPNIDRMPNMTCPVLMIHGTRDEIVPFWNGETLFEETPVTWRARPMWIDGASHNNIEHGTFEDDLRSFLIEWVPGYADSAQCVHRYSRDVMDQDHARCFGGVNMYVSSSAKTTTNNTTATTTAVGTPTKLASRDSLCSQNYVPPSVSKEGPYEPPSPPEWHQNLPVRGVKAPRSPPMPTKKKSGQLPTKQAAMASGSSTSLSASVGTAVSDAEKSQRSTQQQQQQQHDDLFSKLMIINELNMSLSMQNDDSPYRDECQQE